MTELEAITEQMQALLKRAKELAPKQQTSPVKGRHILTAQEMEKGREAAAAKWKALLEKKVEFLSKQPRTYDDIADEFFKGKHKLMSAKKLVAKLKKDGRNVVSFKLPGTLVRAFMIVKVS